ncbi:MAG TPA: glycoside hydrolase domain-containing protein [Streptosporangiaceae bacterium]
MAGGRLAAATLCALMPVSASPAALAPAGQPPAARASAPDAVKTVSYRGYTFRVPGSWPVIDDRKHPRGCVRFDQHAVYLGTVNGDEFCPSWLLGTTESILIQPGPAKTARASAENPVARQITASAPGIAITATFGTDPTVIYRILASAKLPPPVITSPGPDQHRTGRHGTSYHRVTYQGASQPGQGTADGAATRAGHRPAAARPTPRPPLPNAVARYRGLGFDSCTAPSRATMRAWRRHSPYRAIGIFIGGADRACAQPNLSQSWVRAEARAGWRFMPVYAGPQAAFGELHAPARQGRAAARDAVAQARRLGFGRETPIYYDMEAFRPRTRRAALRFLSAWTAQVHRLHFASGVYASSDSGIAYLSRQYRKGRYAMPNVIYDALWNGSPSTHDGHLGRGQWHHHRIHQYSGNVTKRFGGHAINIDKDYVDVRLGRPVTTGQATAAVTLPGGSTDVFYRAHGGQIWFDRNAGQGWARPVRVSGNASSAPSVVYTGSSVRVFYTDRAGYLRDDSYRPDGKVLGSQRLTMMGRLGSAPRAVAQPDGAIDVFWHGSADDHLWHGQYLPGVGWSGPQGLGGDLASGPSPVVSSAGRTTVVWKGRDASLWCVTRGLLGTWTPPRRLGMGPLGGPPLATAQPDGGVQVYWRGSDSSFIWEAFYRPGTGWSGPRDLGGDARSGPWPVTATGTVRVLWRGPGHRLTYIRHRLARQWNVVAWLGPVPLRLGWADSAPFASVGGPAADLHVFWLGRHGALWTAALKKNSWGKPVLLGG